MPPLAKSHPEKTSLITDCAGLEGLLSNPLGEITNKRLQKITERVSLYEFDVNHIPGHKNRICDYLSSKERALTYRTGNRR